MKNPARASGISPEKFSELLFDAGETALKILLVVILTKVFLSFSRMMLSRLFTRIITQRGEASEKRLKTLQSILESALNWAVYFIAVLVVLKQIGIDPMPILAGAGVAGVAIGLGAQSLVKDIIAGFFILLEDQFAVGDRVKINDIEGVVDEISLRIIKLRDKDGSLRILQNGNIASVANFSRKKD